MMVTRRHGDLWADWADGAWAVIPTNTQIRTDGTAVMGAGVAKAAAQRVPELESRYGAALRVGHRNLAIVDRRILCVPTKEHWRDPSTVELVAEAIAAIGRWWAKHPAETLAVPALGCGRGGLDWVVVEQMLDTALQPGSGLAIVYPPR